MTYQAVVNLIRNTAAVVNANGFFMHGTIYDGSLDTTDKDYPQIHLLPIRSTIDRLNGDYLHDITIFFWGQDDPASQPDSTRIDDPAIINREDLIQNMWTLSEAFMDLLFLSNVQITNEFKTPEYRQYSGTVSGYGLSFRLNTKKEC